MNASNIALVSAANVETIDMASLVAFYNANSANQIKKFSTRENAVRRVRALLETLAAESPLEAHPATTADVSNAVKTDTAGAFFFPTSASRALIVKAAEVESKPEAPEGWVEVEGGFEGTGFVEVDPTETDEEMAARLEAEAAADTDEEKAARKERAYARASNSEGVALSWRNPEVRKTRLTRDGVNVSTDGGASFSTYRSVREAFRANRLPDEKHIPFRLRLKASRREVFTKDGIEFLFVM